jgi:hypothetical protein
MPGVAFGHDQAVPPRFADCAAAEPMPENDGASAAKTANGQTVVRTLNLIFVIGA